MQDTRPRIKIKREGPDDYTTLIVRGTTELEDALRARSINVDYECDTVGDAVGDDGTKWWWKPVGATRYRAVMHGCEQTQVLFLDMSLAELAAAIEQGTALVCRVKKDDGTAATEETVVNARDIIKASAGT